MDDRGFWRGKRVLVTGHTGFKGSWLSIWLHALGAKVTGYAVLPPTDPSLFDLCKVDRLVHSVIGDVRDAGRLADAVAQARPELGWRPRWDIVKALEMSVEWSKAFWAREGDLLSVCISQIGAYGDLGGEFVP